MSILSWMIPKRIEIEARVVRWRQPNNSFGLDGTERCFLVEDKEGELHSIICDLDGSPEANLADVGDTVTFSKFVRGNNAYRLKIVSTAAAKPESEDLK